MERELEASEARVRELDGRSAQLEERAMVAESAAATASEMQVELTTHLISMALLFSHGCVCCVELTTLPLSQTMTFVFWHGCVSCVELTTQRLSFVSKHGILLFAQLVCCVF
jgi:hypothetical protein